MNIGFDIDGTIGDYWHSHSTNPNKHKKKWLGLIMIFLLNKGHENASVRWVIKQYISRIKVRMIPIVEAYYITSRPMWLFSTTFQWMTRNGIEPKAIIMAEKHIRSESKIGLVDRAIKKAKAIKNLKLDIYYENEPKMLDDLVKLCPNTLILSPDEAIERGHAIPAY